MARRHRGNGAARLCELVPLYTSCVSCRHWTNLRQDGPKDSTGLLRCHLSALDWLRSNLISKEEKKEKKRNASVITIKIKKNRANNNNTRLVHETRSAGTSGESTNPTRPIAFIKQRRGVRKSIYQMLETRCSREITWKNTKRTTTTICMIVAKSSHCSARRERSRRRRETRRLY